ncbi:hypothetical protein D3C77_277880 [compost metagenome]
MDRHERAIRLQLYFIRQILANIGITLQTAQQKRRNQFAELLELHCVLFPAPGIFRLEGGMSPQISRIKKLKNRPQLAEPVLDRRTCHRNPVRGVKLHDALRLLRTVIFNILRFIKNNRGPFDGLQLLHVSPGQRIRRQHNLLPGAFLPEWFPMKPVAAMVNMQLQPRREPGELLLPIAQQRCWTNDQHRASRNSVQQRCNNLHCFPKPHIVSE